MRPTEDARAMVPHLRVNPDDATAWLVYADALEETHPHFAQHIRLTRGLGVMEPITCFGGALERVAANDYRWKDGTPEPRVKEGSINGHNFRVMGGFVEVPVKVLVGQRGVGNIEIRFVAEGNDLGWYQTPAHHPGYIHVPLADWDAHAKAMPCSIEWDNKDEAAILAKAEQLGTVNRLARGSFTA